MSIIYDPSKLIKKIAPEAKIKRMVTRSMGLKRTALSFVNDIDFIDKDAVARVAIKTVKGYKERIADVIIAAGFDRSAGKVLKDELIDSPKQLVQRVQNEVLFQVKEEIKTKYAGEMARWLPSDAEEPDPEHQLNYGKTYVVGEGINGEEPGDRYGCRCGVEILVNETELKLD